VVCAVISHDRSSHRRLTTFRKKQIASGSCFLAEWRGVCAHRTIFTVHKVKITHQGTKLTCRATPTWRRLTSLASDSFSLTRRQLQAKSSTRYNVKCLELTRHLRGARRNSDNFVSWCSHGIKVGVKGKNSKNIVRQRWAS